MVKTNGIKHIIGLTGGIGSGKTTVSNYLANTYQLPVLDADIYAREAVQLGSPILKAIAERYGQNILLPDGNLDRRQLGQIIFSHLAERQWLEQQIHPYIRQQLVEALHQLSLPTVVMVVPLLFEVGMTDLVTEVWVVACSLSQQLERLMQRDHLTLAQAEDRVNSQIPIAEKCSRADVVLDNSSTQEVLLRQVDTAVQQRI